MPQQQPRSIIGTGTIFTLAMLIFKNLPILLAIFSGLGKFIENFKPARGAEIDTESLAQLIEELTEREVSRIVNSHKEKIRVWVPTEEYEKRQERLDELLEQLEKDQEKYEESKPKDEFEEELEKMKEETRP